MPAASTLPSMEDMTTSLKERSAKRIRALSDDQVFSYLADTLYTERRRIEQERNGDTPPVYLRALKQASMAIRKDRRPWSMRCMRLWRFIALRYTITFPNARTESPQRFSPAPWADFSQHHNPDRSLALILIPVLVLLFKVQQNIFRS